MPKKINTIAMLENKIMDFYRKAGREHLPWRREGITAYEVWVSEIMLQQTQVSRVMEYYAKFLKRFPTVFDVSASSWEEFLPYYAGLGYYRRGHNMLATARKVVAEYKGVFPRDKKLLMTLPGVGDYTASAILSFAYGENYVAWDTNVKRVVGRFLYGDKNSVAIAHHKQSDGAILFKTPAKELNAAFMDFGSAVCTGRPKCKICPLATQCVYFLEGGRQEVGNAKTSRSKDRHWKDAQVYLWLHQQHRRYYSSRPDRFEVFVLSEAYNDRAGIKAYFKDTYGLDVAVRPPHAAVMVNKKPTLFVNAQILLGEPTFAVFSKETVKAYNESIRII